MCSQILVRVMYWIGLHLFNHDTCPSGHISHPGSHNDLMLSGNKPSLESMMTKVYTVYHSISLTSSQSHFPYSYDYEHMTRSVMSYFPLVAPGGLVNQLTTRATNETITHHMLCHRTCNNLSTSYPTCEAGHDMIT